MSIAKNDSIPLTVTATTIDGSGLGHHEGLAVFVPGAAAGDTITAHIVKVKKNYAFARVEEILVPSPDRADPDCPAFPRCGGCVFRHIHYEAELEVKHRHAADTLKRIGHIAVEPEPIIASPRTAHYRNKAQYPVEYKDGRLNIGFYAARSHRVIDCCDCRLQPPEFEGILGVFDRWIQKYNISIYDESTHSGLLRHIYIRTAQATGEMMVCAVVNGRELPHTPELVNALLEKEPHIKSIVLNKNKADTNVILGEQCKTLWGQDTITDELCGLTFQISPLSFYQVNPMGAEILYQKAAEYARLTGKETVLDLYCGAGSIGLTMAATAKEIIGVEVVPRAVADAKINAQINGIENARFICGDAAEAAEILAREGTGPDVVIFDPPRKGCSPALIESVVNMAPARVVYVSCDPATLARDCALFEQRGYTVTNAAPVDMFPRTGHVETVVLMSRA